MLNESANFRNLGGMMKELPDGFCDRLAERDLDAVENLLEEAFPGSAPASDVDADKSARMLVRFVATCCETGCVEQAERVVAVIDAARSRHTAYVKAYARAAFNLLTIYGETGKVDRAAAYYQDIIKNAEQYNVAVALREVFRSGYGLTTYMARQGRLTEAIDTLDALTERLWAAKEHQDYAGAVAKAAYNVMTASGHIEGADAADRIYARLRVLAQHFPANVETAETFALGTHNIVAFLGSKGRIAEAEDRYAEIRELVKVWSDQAGITSSFGQCTVNIVAVLLSNNQIDRALEIATHYAERYRNGCIEELRYAAKTLFNLIPYLVASERSYDLDAVYNRLLQIKDDSSDDAGVVRQVARAEANLSVLAAGLGQFKRALELIHLIAARANQTGDPDTRDQYFDAIVSVAAYAAQKGDDDVSGKLFTLAKESASHESSRAGDRELPIRVIFANVDNTQDISRQVAWIEQAPAWLLDAWNTKVARVSDNLLQQALSLGARDLTRRLINIQSSLNMTDYHSRARFDTESRGKN